MPANPTADEAVVYFIQAEQGGPVKIGYCARRSGVEERLKGLQTGNPYPLVVRHVVDAPNGVLSEREWHDRFAQYRLAGEWFLNAPEVADAAGVTPRIGGQDERLLERVAQRAFDAGCERGRLEGEFRARVWLRKFFTETMEYVFRDPEILEEDLELNSSEQALGAICNQVEMARHRRAVQERLGKVAA